MKMKTKDIGGMRLIVTLSKNGGNGSPAMFTIQIAADNSGKFEHGNGFSFIRTAQFGYFCARFIFGNTQYLLIANPRLTRIYIESNHEVLQSNLGPTGKILHQSLSRDGGWFYLGSYTFGTLLALMAALYAIGAIFGNLVAINWKKNWLVLSLLFSLGIIGVSVVSYKEVVKFRKDYEYVEHKK